MKKRIFGSILALVAVCGLTVLLSTGSRGTTEVHAEGEHVHCICGGNCAAATPENGHVCDATPVWTPVGSETDWTDVIATPAKSAVGTPDAPVEIYAYLTKSFTITKQISSYGPNVHIHLCLNGKTVTRSVSADNGSLKFFLLGYYGLTSKETSGTHANDVTLSVCDCVGTGHIAYMDGKTHNDNHSFVQSGSGEDKVYSWFGGTLDQAKILYTKDPDGNLSNGAISVTNGTFNMYGGTINGAYCKKGTVEAGFDAAAVDGSGGALNLAATATANIYGGTIQNGIAKQGGNISCKGVLNIKGGVVTGGDATNYGGNIALEGSEASDFSKIIMTGGTVSNGHATNYGGNICTHYSNQPPLLQIDGGEILNGSSDGIGGNIAAYTASHLIVNGGLISGGTVTTSTTNGAISSTTDANGYKHYTRTNATKGYGGNIALYGASSLTINGGTIQNGTVTATGTGSAYGGNIAGTSYVNVTAKTTANDSLSYYVPVITINGGTIKNGKVVSSSTTNRVGGGNICAGGFINNILDRRCKLYIHGGTITNDVDPATGTNTQYGVFVTTPKANKVSSKGGNIYIAQTQNEATIDSNVGPVEISNGYLEGTYWGIGGNIATYYTLSVSGNVTIKNGSGVIPSGASGFAGGNLYIADKTITLSEGVKLQNGTANTGGNIHFQDDSHLNMTGVTLENGTAITSGGGNVYGKSSSTSTQNTWTNCTFIGGTAKTYGGNVYITGDTLPHVITGCTFTGGTSEKSGGNFMRLGAAALTLTDSTFSNGTAGTNSGNLQLEGAGANTISGCCFEDGYAQNGGNLGLYNTTELTLDDCELYGGTATVRGGNIFVSSSATAELSLANGTLLSGGKSVSSNTDDGGGNIYFAGKGGLTIEDDTVRIENGSGSKGGNILTAQGKDYYITMDGGTITGGKASNSGGNIFLSGVMTMNGGEISFGTGSGGGNIFVNISNSTHDRGIFTMNDGIIKNGSTTNLTGQGANITLNGGTTYYGGRCILNGGTVLLEDLTASGGKDYTTGTGVGRNIYSKGYLEIAGAEVIGGNTTGTNISGGSITFDTSTSRKQGFGGAVYCEGSTAAAVEPASFIMSDGAIKDGEAAISGGNLAILDRVTVSITGGTISGGTAGTSGGNIYVEDTALPIGGVAIIKDGTVNTASGQGGNIYTDTNVTATFDDSVQVLNGEASMGGNLYSKGTTTIYFGEFSGGYATLNGGNIRTTGGTVTISGGLFKNGTAGGATEADNVFFVSNTAVTISGGEFLNASTAKPNVWIHNNCSNVSVTGGYFSGIFHGTEGTKSLGEPACITGGKFVYAPDSYSIADGYAAFPLSPTESTGNATYYYEIRQGVVVLTTSRSTVIGSDTTATAGLAALSGGGVYAPADGITLTAEDVDRYEFVGWWVNEYTGSAAATTKTYAPTNVTKDTLFIAVYRLTANDAEEDGVTYTIIGDHFTLAIGTGSPVAYTGSATGKVPVGTKLALASTDSTFEFWKNETEKLVSRSWDYEFNIFVDTQLTAQLGSDTTTVITFLSYKKQVVKQIETTTAITADDIPALPVRVGYTGGGWNKTLSEINEAIAGGAKFVEVSANDYEEAEEEYTVTLKTVLLSGGAWTAAGTDTTVTVKKSEVATLTAPTSPSSYFTFLYFAAGSASEPNVLSYNTEYSLFAEEDATIYAVFARKETVETIDKVPSIVLTMNKSTDQGNGKYTLTVGVTRDLPEGYELVEQGILMTTKDDADMIYGEAGVTKVISSGTVENGVTLLNIKNAPAGSVVFARGYLIVRKAEDEFGDTDILYTEIAACIAE